jgi:hypothetical protein
MRRRSTTATIAMRAASSPWRGCTHRMPASACSSASTISRGALVIGRVAMRSMSTASQLAPAASSAAARLAATSRLASSAISATRSPGWIARQTSTALCAPASRSGTGSPNTSTPIDLIVRAPAA